MRARVVDRITETGTMDLREAPLPPCRADGCVLAVEAAGVNFLDTLMMRGLYQVKPPLPFTPGIAVVGIVARKGPDSSYEIGQRICALPVPANILPRDAVALPAVYPTAFLALRDRAWLQPKIALLMEARL